MYTLRNFTALSVHSPKDVKEAIFTQVGETVVSRKLDFQVGYYNKASKLWLKLMMFMMFKLLWHC